jgi:Ca2+/Na+ antiporter
MAEKNSHNDRAEQLLYLFKNRHLQLLRVGKLSAIFLFAGIFTFGIASLGYVESLLYLSPVIKTFSWIVILLFAAFLTYWSIQRSSRSGFTEFYRDFCNQYSLSTLKDAFDLYLSQDEKKSGLHALAIEKNLAQLNPGILTSNLSDFTRNHRNHKQFITTLVFLTVTLLMSGSLYWSNPEAVTRSLNFWSDYEIPNPYEFVIVPGDTTLEHGTSFEPEVHISTGPLDRLQGNVRLAIKTDIEDVYRYRPMEQTSENSFRSAPLELTGKATYYVQLNEFTSNIYNVDVQLRPRFETLAVEITPPSYTGLSTTTLNYPFAVARAYGGSEITVNGISNKPLENLILSLSTADIQMTTSEDQQNRTQFSTSFRVSDHDTVSFHMSDLENLTNRNPFRFQLSKIEDEYPVVVIREPGSDLSIPEPESLDIFYQAADDFGLTRATLNWELHRAFADQPQMGSMDLETPVIGEASHIAWNLQGMGLRPRDKLTFWIKVWDNDEFNGFKPANSQRLSLEVPSVSAFLDDINRRERNVQDSLDDVSESYRQMEQEYQQFRERMQQNTEPGWEEEQLLDDIHERQSEVEESIKEINDQFEEIRREIENSNHVSEDTRRAYQELQDLMDQLDDPELLRALEELQRAMQDFSMRDIEQAMENFEFNEQVYKERLDRTLELFKTLKMNSDLDKLASQYEDLADRMDHLSQQEQTSNEQYEEQQGIREDTDSIENQLENLDNRPPKRAEERLRQLKQETTVELNNIQEELDRLIEDSLNDSGNPEENRQMQQELGQQFQQRAESLRDAQQEMGGQQIQVNLFALQQSLYTLLELSESQEELTKLTGRTESRSQGYIDLAREQQNIRNQFSQVADTLYRVSSEIPSLSNNITRKKAEIEQILTRSLEQMAEREQRTSVINSRESLGGINDLASMLAEAIDQLMDQQSGEGGGMSMQQMLEQMQNMSGDQQMMNQQLQELINDIQGERLTQDQSDRLEQLARQQNEIRQQLEMLQRSGALREGDRTLSELQRMAEQMEDAINDMRGGMTDPLMIERQQNILSRMLNVEESLQERGESEEYEGHTPGIYDRTVPPDITLEELRQEIRNRLQDPQYTRFRDDYQRLIERYFELLRRFEESPLP